jgi:hypothetical protein
MPLSLTSNTAGQMYALTVLTPIMADRVATLQSVLEKLPKRPSPLARVTGTHFARFVVIADFISDPSQPAPEHLPSPYLLFSATLDGDRGPYLDELCDKLGDEAQQIWGCCVGAPDPARGAPLKAYLTHNQLDTGLFFSAYPQADVETVKAALALRRRTIDFAVRGQGMSPEDLQAAFLKEF